MHACETFETVFGDDVSYKLRILGLRMLAAIDRELFPYYAVEHLDDFRDGQYDNEPAVTTIRLLAATGNFVALYQWLRREGLQSPNLLVAFNEFASAPPAMVERFVVGAIDSAIRSGNEPLCIALAEAIVDQEIEASYPSIAQMMAGKVGDDLYHYLAMLLARTNRAPLLGILEDQLRRGRRPKLVLEALNVRPTDETRAIIARWEER